MAGAEQVLGFLRGDFVWAAVRTVILAEEGRRKLPRKSWIVVSQDKTWCSGSPGSGWLFVPKRKTVLHS